MQPAHLFMKMDSYVTHEICCCCCGCVSYATRIYCEKRDVVLERISRHSQPLFDDLQVKILAM